MSKIKTLTAAALAAVLLAGATACGTAADPKYDRIISRLEAGDYEGAKAEIDRLASKETVEPTYEVVEVTKDNWQEYFEFREKTLTNKNDFGECTDVYKSTYLVLKDGYTLGSPEQSESTKIAIEIDYVSEWRYVTVDTENQTVTYNDPVPDKDVEEVKGATLTVWSEETPLTMSRSWSNGMQETYRDFEIVRIQGKLVLKK